MELPIELVKILQHTGIDGKTLTWDLQVNSSRTIVKLMWIKAEKKPIEKNGKATSQDLKSKHLSPSTRKRNAKRITEWKAKRNEAVDIPKLCAETQTEVNSYKTDVVTQTEPLHSDDQALHTSTSRHIRERSTQTNSDINGRQLTPTKYINDTEESVTPWTKCSTVSCMILFDELHAYCIQNVYGLYNANQLSYKTIFQDGSVSFSESFDSDDPALIDRYPVHTTERYLGDRPPTPCQQWVPHSEQKARKQKKTAVRNT